MAVKLKLLTPNNTVYDRAVEMVVLRTSEGEMGVMAGHEPCSVVLTNSEIRIYEGGEVTDIYAILWGFAVVESESVTVVSQIAEKPELVAETLRQIEMEREENRKVEQQSDLEIQRYETALRHALVNMDVSSYAIIKGRYDKSDE